MKKYEFYYDESEHSRKIGYKTVSAVNYYDNFVTTIVGCQSESKDILCKYEKFEDTYLCRKNKNGEIKSTTFKQKDFKYGIASLNKQNTMFLKDFLDIFDIDVHIYFSINSKIEYLISQLFKEYGNDGIYDIDLMKYSIVKALITYRPERVIECIYESPEKFLKELRKFFRDRIEQNSKNVKLKKREINNFEQILLVLDNISTTLDINWDYHVSFDGFNKYLQENEINDYILIIDKEGKEGEDSKTFKAAKNSGLKNVYEEQSTKFSGLRIADMMAGIISKLLKGLNDSLRYHSLDESIQKKLLDEKWFKLDENQLKIYKRIFKLMNKSQHSNNIYHGIYSDDIILLLSLLEFMNEFDSSKEIKEHINTQGENFNSFACNKLSDYFLEVAKNSNDERRLLALSEGQNIIDVQKVVVDQNNNPVIVVLENGVPKYYYLPEDLTEWHNMMMDKDCLEV